MGFLIDSSNPQMVQQDQPVESYNFIWNTNTLSWERATGALTGAGNVVTINNFPATQPISGAVAQSGAWTVQPGNTPNTVAWVVDGSAVTQPVSAASLPLPTNASQEHTAANSPSSTRLTDGTIFYKATTPSDTQPISGNVGQGLPNTWTNAWPTKLISSDGSISAFVTSASALKVDGSGVTQPISGSVAISNTPAVTQSGTWNVGLSVGSNNIGGVELIDSGGSNKASISAAGALKIDGSASTQPVSAASLPLPSGAAQEHTAANSPSSVRLTDGTTFYKGTTPSDTQPVSGIFWQATQPVSGTVSINSIPAGSNLIGNVELVDGAGSNKASISAAGAIKVDGSASTQPVSGTFWQNTQPVSGTVSINSIPAGSALIGNVELVDANGTNKATISAAGAVKVDGSGATQPISGTITADAGVNLNTSLLALESGHLATIDSHIPAQGQATMASSLPVVLASNQTSIPVTGTFYQTTQPVSGTVSLSDYSYPANKLSINGSGAISTNDDLKILLSQILITQKIISNKLGELTGNGDNYFDVDLDLLDL